MADYTISVTFGALGTGGDMTPAAIRDALETLTGTDRLDASAIQNLPNAEDPLTIAEIVTGLEALTGTNRLDASKLKNLIKTNVDGAEKALNFIAEGNVWSGTFQASYPSSGLYAWDFFIAKNIDTDTNGETVETKDWCIALTANPGFDFTNTTKWYILKVSKIPTKEVPFRKYREEEDGSGIMPTDVTNYRSMAAAPYSFAVGYEACVPVASVGSVATGRSAVASRPGSRAFASGKFEHNGDVQYQEMVLRLETLNTVPTEMILPGAITVKTGKTYLFKVRLVARNYGGTYAKSWEWSALISPTTIAATPTISTPTTLSVGTSALAATLTFNATAPQRLVITCTGLATRTRWVAYVETLEVFMDDDTGGIVNNITGEYTATYVD